MTYISIFFTDFVLMEENCNTSIDLILDAVYHLKLVNTEDRQCLRSIPS